MRETMELFVQFGKTRDRDPADSEVQAQVKHLQEFFCENFYSYNIPRKGLPQPQDRRLPQRAEAYRGQEHGLSQRYQGAE